MKHHKKITSQRKAQEGHLEEGKTAKPANCTKSANQAKWQRRAKKSSKSQNSKLPLKQTTPNTLNAWCPP
jgi:hypothetical protein